ncbi:exportin-6-like, partial [Mizuhopecten yessoensis]
SYGQSFLQSDIEVFRQNLNSLQQLNSKWRLYQKPIFKDVMLFQFTSVLLQVLVHRSHDLLQEEIVMTIYNMASVDFGKFYSEFLPRFVGDYDGLDANQKTILGQNFRLDQDLPSFMQSVQRLVNDLRFYKLVNSSLPEGSVNF